MAPPGSACDPFLRVPRRNRDQIHMARSLSWPWFFHFLIIKVKKANVAVTKSFWIAQYFLWSNIIYTNIVSCHIPLPGFDLRCSDTKAKWTVPKLFNDVDWGGICHSISHQSDYMPYLAVYHVSSSWFKLFFPRLFSPEPGYYTASPPRLPAYLFEDPANRALTYSGPQCPRCSAWGKCH